VEEFIERFARFTTETEIVVPALPHATSGATGMFVICLKDHSEVMKGRCEVIEIRPVAVAPDAAKKPWGPMLMRLRLREMDAHSCGIHLRLMERHAASMRASSEAAPAVAVAAPPSVPVETPPEAVPADSTVGDTSAVTVVSNEPPPSDARPPPDAETTEISPLPQADARAPAASFVLPANPLSELDASDLASFVELKLLESSGARPMRPLVDRARRIGRRVAPFAALAIVGVFVGMAVRPGSKAVPVAVAPRVAPPAGRAAAGRAAGRAAAAGARATIGRRGAGRRRSQSAGLRRAREDHARRRGRAVGRDRARVEPHQSRGGPVRHRDHDDPSPALRGCHADDGGPPRATR
jgi:hypothetical protein